MKKRKLRYSEADGGWTRIAFIGESKFGQCAVTMQDGRWVDANGDTASYLGIVKLGTIWIWRTG